MEKAVDRCSAAMADVADFTVVSGAVNRVEKTEALIAVPVNNAGLNRDHMIHKMSEELHAPLGPHH